MLKPDYERAGVTLYCGDCRDVLPQLDPVAAVVTDPPYGINYGSSMTGHDGGTALPGIVGDGDTSLRDHVVAWAGDTAALIFGSWKRPPPCGCRMRLVWEKGDHVGMGDLSIPWKPNTEDIYVLGTGFIGHRGSAVLHIPAPVTWNSARHGRVHPHEKPLELMVALVGKCPKGVILDPFMGSGTTGVACVRTGRRFVGIEIEPKYFDIAVRRIDAELRQGRFEFAAAAQEPADGS